MKLYREIFHFGCEIFDELIVENSRRDDGSESLRDCVVRECDYGRFGLQGLDERSIVVFHNYLKRIK